MYQNIGLCYWKWAHMKIWIFFNVKSYKNNLEN